MTIRPTKFTDFHGQPKAIGQLRVAIASAKIRKATLGHVLLYGGAGLGKTSLAQYVIPAELGVACHAINCAAVEKPQDLLPTLSTIKAGNILFLDEIHMLPVAMREHLLSVMEDSALTVNIGSDDKKNLVSVKLPKYTIIGATTRLGLLPETLQDRFKLKLQLETYSDEDMASVLTWIAARYDLVISDNHALVPACHGTARIAVNIIESCLDTITADGLPPDVTHAVALTTLSRIGYIGELTRAEANVIKALHGAPGTTLGLSALAAVLDDTVETVEGVYEPWLMQAGYITRTPAGRKLTTKGVYWYAENRGRF